jgi:hypothetical protein
VFFYLQKHIAYNYIYIYIYKVCLVSVGFWILDSPSLHWKCRKCTEHCWTSDAWHPCYCTVAPPGSCEGNANSLGPSKLQWLIGHWNPSLSVAIQVGKHVKNRQAGPCSLGNCMRLGREAPGIYQYSLYVSTCCTILCQDYPIPYIPHTPSSWPTCTCEAKLKTGCGRKATSARPPLIRCYKVFIFI